MTLHTVDPQNESDTSFAYDQLQVMRLQEEDFYRCHDYIACNERFLNDYDAGLAVDEDCRLKMCQWCFEIADYCDFQRETVAHAISLLDRYLCTNQGTRALSNMKDFQLAAMTALHIAVKIHETVFLDTEVLVLLSKDAYGVEDFEGMEIKMLIALQWRLNGPTPHTFIRCFMRLVQESTMCIDSDVVSNLIINDAMKQAENAIFEYNIFVDRLPSEIALAALFNVITEIDNKDFSVESKEAFVCAVQKLPGLVTDDLMFLQASLYQLHHNETLFSAEQCSDNKDAEENSISCLPSPERPISVA